MISGPGNSFDLIHTNNNCTGCNRCIKVCSIPGANISFTDPEDGLAHIRVNGDWCIKCGACLDACEHDARDYEDDTDRFFRDLESGKPITLLIAPSFKANYPEDYERILGGLKALGIRHMISVSFGADISLWAYLKYIKEHSFYGNITNPCPVVVDYIEKYEPKLIPSLSPVQTPLMCAAIYARKELGLTEDFAFLSPCIAKKVEIDRPQNQGLVQYNVTYKHFMSYVRAHNIYGEPCLDELQYDLGTIYPMPGGLTEYAHWLTGEDLFTRQIEGEKYLYDYLQENAQRIIDGKTPFSFIDALNCQKGCLCGTAVEHRKNKAEDALYELAGIRQAVKRDSALTKLAPADRLKELERRFGHIDLDDYLITYEDKSCSFKLKDPGDENLEAIFLDMDKTTDEAIRLLNKFRAMGIRLLMDDFGTGYSALGYLSFIPVDIVKIDKSLVDNFLVEGQDHFINNVNVLVHDLGKRIIFEGVERQKQIELLTKFNADIIQGYYYSEPLLPEDAIRFKADMPY